MNVTPHHKPRPQSRSATYSESLRSPSWGQIKLTRVSRVRDVLGRSSRTTNSGAGLRVEGRSALAPGLLALTGPIGQLCENLRVARLVRARVATLVVSAVVLALSGCTSATGSSSSTCAAGGSVPADVTMPDPDHIDVNVLNASGVNGRALDVFVDLGQRGFQMFSTTEGLSPDAYPEAVVIRYQPRTAGAAWLLSLYFHGRVRSQLGGTTDSDRVDVILGSAYAGVLTPAEVQQAVAVAESPSAPTNTCASTNPDGPLLPQGRGRDRRSLEASIGRTSHLAMTTSRFGKRSKSCSPFAPTLNATCDFMDPFHFLDQQGSGRRSVQLDEGRCSPSAPPDVHRAAGVAPAVHHDLDAASLEQACARIAAVEDGARVDDP